MTGAPGLDAERDRVEARASCPSGRRVTATRLVEDRGQGILARMREVRSMLDDMNDDLGGGS